ncbi:hypothetical protein OESDEN_01667 [Oesophagostomum dentatum]|uniref:Uncharacterized protein n=1 Tax=Oesophagostomum dentatum TaxID=61180 RepID=A0A0B1TSG0_OESDE|nr:hypothetical protein OESDEN_01667 [Oesophagostomum dentatum]
MHRNVQQICRRLSGTTGLILRAFRSHQPSPPLSRHLSILARCSR